ncbi:hypothetical protein COI31_10870 [Neisseria meningitidis]|nr:hypothetical protein COI31_10870 [Neisseria meningitidis]
MRTRPSLLVLSYIPSINPWHDELIDDINFGKRVMMVTFFAFLDAAIESFLIKSLGRFILPRLFLCYRPKSPI